MSLFGTIDLVKEQAHTQKFERAFEYLEKLQDKNSPEYKIIKNIELEQCEKIELNKNCFVLLQSYITKDKEDCFFESHRKYIDIQYMFEGEEIMEAENIENLTITSKYDEKLDFAKYTQSTDSSILRIRQNELAIFYQLDAHMPCIKIDKNKKIIKAVIKVAI